MREIPSSQRCPPWTEKSSLDREVSPGQRSPPWTEKSSLVREVLPGQRSPPWTEKSLSTSEKMTCRHHGAFSYDLGLLRDTGQPLLKPHPVQLHKVRPAPHGVLSSPSVSQMDFLSEPFSTLAVAILLSIRYSHSFSTSSPLKLSIRKGPET